MLTGCARKNNRINSTHSWLAGPGPVCTRGGEVATGEERRPPPGEDVRTRDALPHDIDESLDSSLCLAFSREVFDSVAAEMPVSGSSPRLALLPLPRAPPSSIILPPPPLIIRHSFFPKDEKGSVNIYFVDRSKFTSREIAADNKRILSSSRLVRWRASVLSDVSIKTFERNYLRRRNDNRE